MRHHTFIFALLGISVLVFLVGVWGSGRGGDGRGVALLAELKTENHEELALTSSQIRKVSGKSVDFRCCSQQYVACVTDQCVRNFTDITSFERCAFRCERSGFPNYPSLRACRAGRTVACVLSEDIREGLPKVKE